MRAPAILAPVLRERVLCISLLAACLLLVLANLAGISLLQCNFQTVTGLPCPGCGMTRGMAALLRGHFQEAWRWHPFTPLLALSGVVVLLATGLPEPWRFRLIALIESIERRTGIVLVAGIGLIVYGVWRMLWPTHWH